MYDEQDRLLSYGPTSYTYDARGNRATKLAIDGLTTYSYDALNNLVAVQTGVTVIEYLYDGLNRRIGKKVNGVLVQGFLYEDGIRPLAELDGNNNLVNQFVYGTNVPDYIVHSGVVYRLGKDQVGSVRVLVDAETGQLVQELQYDSFGNVILANPAFASLSPAIQPFGFAGGLYDADTGLVRFGARDYDPETGEWASKDPIRFAAGGANLYSYCESDPVNAKDPSGLTVVFVEPVLGQYWQLAKNASPSAAAIMTDLETSGGIVTVRLATSDEHAEMKQYGGADTSPPEFNVCHGGNDFTIRIDPKWIDVRAARSFSSANIPAVLAHEATHAWADNNDLDDQGSDIDPQNYWGQSLAISIENSVLAGFGAPPRR